MTQLITRRDYVSIRYVSCTCCNPPPKSLNPLPGFFLGAAPEILLRPRNSKLCLPNFCSIFLCHRRWLWQIRSLQMFWWCKGSSCHQGDGDQVSKLHGLLAPQRVPYGHPNAPPKSAPNLHPGAEHFYWISHKGFWAYEVQDNKKHMPFMKKDEKVVNEKNNLYLVVSWNIPFRI